MVGLLDVKADCWLATCQHDKTQTENWTDFECSSKTVVRLLLTAFNPEVAKAIRGLVGSIEIATRFEQRT